MKGFIYSEIVSEHREEQEDIDLPVISSDGFIFLIISPHKKEKITFSIKYDFIIGKTKCKEIFGHGFLFWVGKIVIFIWFYKLPKIGCLDFFD